MCHIRKIRPNGSIGRMLVGWFKLYVLPLRAFELAQPLPAFSRSNYCSLGQNLRLSYPEPGSERDGKLVPRFPGEFFRRDSE